MTYIRKGKRVMNKVELQEHYGAKVWTNTFTDNIRRQECLCLFCKKIVKGDREKNCPIAQRIFDLSVKHDIAAMMTRCKEFEGDV